ncbi:50S ribosomal protein L37Ae [Nanobdella aerobiophila]|uniref:Large ribosomal subunit protein eL43 n=1 Tax=Nanobdella aerobiophila TaxID=2586965 RepID=A0A915SAI2_9ARCH|nr:50S ribosomal protein L37ae [Nanobdella aerobiophila]BBL45787.1 50S ribosomal protein L37Ae [Nanobdella aerobiophila]
MSHTQILKSTGRFGARYGKSIREALLDIEKNYRNKRNKCPYCNYYSVKRVAYGIWSCKHCGKVFTGKAYSI